MKKLIKFTLFFFIVLFHSISLADKGLFWWDSDARFTQSAQKAIILHNFKEEVLILETELQVNIATEALEFIPFPSEPEVELAKGDPFNEMNKIIDKKRLAFEEQYYKGSLLSEPVEISESKRIGLHDVTVVKINSIDRFNEWIEKFLRKKGIKKRGKTLARISEIAKDYIQRGIQYFVFDYIKVENIFQRVEPLIYRFKTDRLYYPLKTSSIIGGEGRVEIVIIMPEFFEETGLEMIELSKPFPEYNLPFVSNHAEIAVSELVSIYHKLANFFPKDSKLFIQMLLYRGLYEFKDDLYLDISRIVEDRQTLKRELINATITAIEKSWQKISKDKCILVTEEIKGQFERWRVYFSSLEPNDYRVNTSEFLFDTYENESLKIYGFGPLLPPSIIKKKINKSVKVGDIIEDEYSKYEVIKVSERMNNSVQSERRVTLYLVYNEYDIASLSSTCIFRFDTRNSRLKYYYVYVDE